ncbi:6411_t:CDS:1, partial [Rhizophagus irregularis]
MFCKLSRLFKATFIGQLKSILSHHLFKLWQSQAQTPFKKSVTTSFNFLG